MSENISFKPLASRMRPAVLQDFIGQEHLLGSAKPLRVAIDKGILHSMILWGPPGTGKTTLARLLTLNANAHFENMSAIFSGVKDIRRVVSEAKARKEEQGIATVLFIDEIHRFNKSQQDAFLPFVEEGVITLIGATTENPSFELNNALLSRLRVYTLKMLTSGDLQLLLERTLHDKENGFGDLAIEFPQKLQDMLIAAADGDARQLLNLLEILLDLADSVDNKVVITKELLSSVLQHQRRRFDKQGEYFYDQISALHKAIRGSAPDAALYWFAAMIEGGIDPLYIARRLVRVASEDIGNADPRALTLTLNAWDTAHRLGQPEGDLALAQAVVYLSCAPKSNAVYVAYKAALKDAKNLGSLEVPLHLRNAPTKLMKDLDYGKDYRYAHDEPGAYAAGENYFPEKLKSKTYYHPVPRGLEIKIKEKLEYLKGLDNKKNLATKHP